MHNEIKDGVFFGAVIQGQHTTIQLPPTVSPALGGLPRRSSTFEGRSHEVGEIIASLHPSTLQNEAVIAVTGMAGVGKTELALQVAHSVLGEKDWFPGGALFIDLSGYDAERRVEPREALGSLLNSLGLPPEIVPDETQDRARMYRSVLRSYAEHGRRILVIVDNADSVDQASHLIPSDGKNAALITSRHTLSIDAELYDLGVLQPESAVEVIRAVIRRHRGTKDIRVQRESAETLRVAELCGFLPLALQIAAALLADSSNRPIKSLVDELTDAHSRLDALTREERALRAAFDLSYRRLPKDQAHLFRLLPINAGPDVSGEAVSRLSNLELRTTGRILESLNRAHLIEVGQEWGRWRLHDLLRIYANEKGAAEEKEDGRDQAIRRLLDYYSTTSESADWILRDRASKAEGQRFRDRRGEPLEWFRVEEDNLLAAIRLAERKESFESVYYISMHLGLYLDVRRRVADVIEVASTALRAARQIENVDWQARSLNHLGLALSTVRRFGDAITPLTEGAKLARMAGNREVECDILIALGAALRQTDGPAAGIAPLKRALTLGRAMGNPLHVGTALTNLGNTYRESGRLAEAAKAYGESIRYHQLSGDRRKEASGHSGLAATFSQLGNIEESLRHFKKAVAMYKSVGDQHGLAVTLMNLGSAHTAMGDFQNARDILQQSRVCYRESHDPHGEGVTLLNLSFLERDAGNQEKSRAYFEMAQELFHPK
ncbi:tetratricopeptide repeat protein [Streptomyces sp. ME02-8801-2C]|uniref:tetratricopeptide repeat protein n=1 Tax=Streptomyces sp. ME02-8801-2C TaxID=3028680 RepID=UPI0029A9F6B3|nr:tetratricopeptide repeat protein [Streptomyces sp. ME02-8801-2C]MDX3453080.1 tetratricopeptide repeat protein [Streptomyces sp. ME02-8801-2C]